MSTALARQQPKGGDLAARLREAMPRLQASLPAHFTAEKMIQLLNVVVYRTPDLQRCDPESIITAAVQAGSLGLDLNPGLNEAFIIPRGGVATFMPGYKGLEKLAVNTGTVAFIHPREVCENDVFRVIHNPDTTVTHEIDYRRPRGEITHIYAVAELSNGKQIVEVMATDEIEGIRKRSQMPNAGPWRNDWKEMGCKTLVKRMCKRLPRSSDQRAAKAFEALNAAIECDNTEYQDAAPEHHALNHNNNTGHGSGAYAPPEVVADYQKWMREFVKNTNDRWESRVTGPGRLEPAEVPKKYRELCSTFQVSGHVVKWARDCKMIEAPEEARLRQYDQFAAVAWMRDREAVKTEIKRYVGSLFSVAWAALFPEPDDAPQSEPVPAEDATQDTFNPDADDVELPPEDPR